VDFLHYYTRIKCLVEGAVGIKDFAVATITYFK
jgi:hypothetical protein